MMNVKKVSGTRFIPVFQKEFELLRGGATITGESAGTVLPAGTAMTYDESTRLAEKAVVDGDPAESNAKGYLYEEVTIGEAGTVTTGDIVIRGTLYKRRVPQDDIDDHLKATPLVIGSESF